MAITLRAGRLEEVIFAMKDCLSESERRDTRALILAEGEQPTLADLMGTRSVASLMASVQERWLVEMIRDQRLTTHFQPIVRVGDPGEVYAYECLLRGKMEDGSLVSPDRIYGAARESELLFQLDRAARLTSIREAVAHGIRERLFINFNPSSIYDPTFCLRSTITAINRAGINPDRIVFEVVESDRVDADLLSIMATYRKAGFRVALDDLGAGYGSLNLLSSLRPDIVKLDMRLVRDVDRDRYKAGITSKLLEMARKLEIAIVAEGIETAEEFEWFRDHGADFVQGYFIARPASPPPLPSSIPQRVARSTRSAS
jgi:EAL domain-containing protein (putative c-di-GMP-specific phosphodiesterase class I)